MPPDRILRHPGPGRLPMPRSGGTGAGDTREGEEDLAAEGSRRVRSTICASSRGSPPATPTNSSEEEEEEEESDGGELLLRGGIPRPRRHGPQRPRTLEEEEAGASPF
jgi:hypothetical protein